MNLIFVCSVFLQQLSGQFDMTFELYMRKHKNPVRFEDKTYLKVLSFSSHLVESRLKIGSLFSKTGLQSP